jgi:hypothetical protein
VIRHGDTRILTRIPQGAGTGKVSVNGAQSPTDFNVLAAGSPVIFRAIPAKVPQGAHFALVGYGLELGQTGTLALDANVLTVVRGGGRFLAGQVPASLATGVYTVNVTNALGLTTGPCTTQIEVIAPPTASISSVTPSTGPGGTRFLISGTGFYPPGPLPLIWTDAAGQNSPHAALSNGVDEAYSFVPFRLAAGTYTITLRTRYGNPTATFDVTAPVLQTPVIHLLDPASGPATFPGTRIPKPFRVVGEHFVQRGGGQPALTFGGTAARIFGFFFGAGGRQVLLTAPPPGTAPGVYDVQVTNAGGASNLAPYTVTP